MGLPHISQKPLVQTGAVSKEGLAGPGPEVEPVAIYSPLVSLTPWSMGLQLPGTAYEMMRGSNMARCCISHSCKRASNAIRRGEMITGVSSFIGLDTGPQRKAKARRESKHIG